MQEITRATAQILDFQKGVFNSLFEATSKIQIQSESMANEVIEQFSNYSPQGTAEGLKAYMQMYKLGNQNAKQFIDGSFDQLKAYFAN